MLDKELRKLLNESFDISGKSFYIWGTGNTTLLYQEGLCRLEKEGTLHIEGYVDNNSSKWGQMFCDKPIISPDELSKQGNICVLICSPQPHVIHAIKQQLAELKIEGYHIDEVIFRLHKEEVLKCYDLLNDVESQETYAHI